MPPVPPPTFRFATSLRTMLLVGVTAFALSACASNRTNSGPIDYSGLSQGDAQSNLAQLAVRFEANRGDKQAAIYYSAALRAVGQNKQAISVMEVSLDSYQDDADVNIAYAKALASDGRFSQALNVLDNTIRPEAPNWRALLVKGAILDQMGRNQEARVSYASAMLIAPNEASIEANLGLSYSMTGDLENAEKYLRAALTKRGASSRIRQNLALVLGLQGRFEEARTIYLAELPADQVEANMAYIRALLTQQNRWDVIESNG